MLSGGIESPRIGEAPLQRQHAEHGVHDAQVRKRLGRDDERELRVGRDHREHGGEARPGGLQDAVDLRQVAANERDHFLDALNFVTTVSTFWASALRREANFGQKYAPAGKDTTAVISAVTRMACM